MRWWGLCLLLTTLAPAAEERLVNSFETEDELRQWQITAAGARLVGEGVTHGRQALELTFDPAGQWFPAHLSWNRPVTDWSPWDALLLDVFNPLERPVRANLLVADQAWRDHGSSYWNRHNSDLTFAPGPGRWLIPVRGLYRGEAGSRNNDLKRDIDPDAIVRLDFGFGHKGETGRIIIDHLRFVKVDRPATVRAFDFGPPSQAVMLGWTPVSHATGYAAGAGHGWFPANNRPWDGAARDTTFGPLLTRDFCEAGGYSFRVDVPAGLYDVLLVWENSGYWGGEQSRHTTRRVLVDGQVMHSETRPDGPATALYRFEDIEPVGVDLWATYMEPELCRPVRFKALAGEQGLTFQFEREVPFGCKVSALALAPTGDAAARAWLDEQWRAVADEFRAQAVDLGARSREPGDPAGPGSLRPLHWWPVELDEDVTPDSFPSPGRPATGPSAVAVRGEFEPLSVALRPAVDLGECRLRLEPEPGWPPSTISVVRYNTSRGFGSIAYRILPHTVRETETVALPARVTRQLIVTCHVTADTPPGEQTARLVILRPDGARAIEIPLKLTVEPVLLERDSDFLTGYFGLLPPAGLLPPERLETALDETLRLLRSHGANAVCGGPNWRLTGWRDGQPQLDFTAVDAFFQKLRQAGFNRPINGYGGLRFEGLHDGYQLGPTAQRVAQASGLDYREAFRRCWQAVDAHARAAGWPTIYYAMCDETRVRATAEAELQFMRLMAEVTRQFPDTVRTSGSYSVDFRTRPTDENDLKLWHQRFFEALDISSLNLHDPTVMAEARRLDKEIHIYNQGRSRFSFGLYQWAEFQRGVTARWQWHLNILHGYQYFDLDGREPDTAMICYGRERLYPTIHFERCREGAEEFYLLQTLHRRLAANPNRPGGAAAAAWLAALVESVALNQRQPPPGYDPARLKAEAIGHLKAL